MEKSIILIVDDIKANILLLELFLKELYKSKYTIIKASNGKEAISIIESNKNIKLILMDIKMPVMDGIEATSYIKQTLRCNLPIIAITAYDKEFVDTNNPGFSEYLIKPIDLSTLKITLDNYL